MEKRKKSKWVLVIIAALAMCVIGAVAAFAADETNSPGSKGEIDVYLIAGQSNAVGYGGYLGGETLSASIMNDPRYTEGFKNVLYYGTAEENVKNEFVPVTVGLGRPDKDNIGVACVGAEVGIAAAVGDSNRMSAVIKHAIGGSYLYPTTDGTPAATYGTWTPPSYIEKYGVDTSNNKIGDIYEAFKSTVTAGIGKLVEEGYTPVIKGIWWMQGEAETPDGFTARAEAYEELLTALIAEMRSDLQDIMRNALSDNAIDLSALPFVMGEITRNNKEKPYTEGVALVNAAQIAVTGGKVANTYRVQTSDLTQVDSWHYNSDGQHTIGQRFIAVLNSIAGKHSVSVSGMNVSFTGGGAYAKDTTVTVSFAPYENCVLNSVKIKIGDQEPAAVTLDGENSYTFTMPDADVTFVVDCKDPNAITTAYGVIPSIYTDADKYPFILFKDGEMLSAYATYDAFINTSTSLGCTLLMRRDYSTTEGASAWGLRDMADLTLDLGGFTLTRGDNHLFQALGKNDYSNTAVLRIINGTLKTQWKKDSPTVDENGNFVLDENGNKTYASTAPLIVFNNDSTCTVSDKFEFILDGITIDVSSGRGIVACYGNGVAGADAKIVLNNCTIYRGKSTSTSPLFALADSSGNKNDIDVVINGGKLVANTLTGLKMATFNDEREEGKGSPDTLTFGENKMVVELPSNYDATNDSLEFTEGFFCLENPTTNAENGNLIYELDKPDTVYGNIPSDWSSVTDYPFVLFKNGKAIHAFGDWGYFINKEVTLSSDYQTGCTLLLRRDYSTSEASVSNWAFRYVNDITIDLGEKTITRGTKHLFNLISQGTNSETSITVKNGTIKTASGQMAPITFNNDSNSVYTAKYTVTFDGVKFDVSSGKGVIESACNSTYKETGKTVSSVTFNNCEFILGDYAGTMTLFNLNQSANLTDTAVVVNGGKLTANTTAGVENLTFADFNKEVAPSPDTLTVKGDFEVILPTGVVGPDKTYAFTDGEYYLVKDANNTDSTSTYHFYEVEALKASLKTEHGDIALRYASVLDYPFVLFKNGEVKLASAKWNDLINNQLPKTEYASGCVLLLRRGYSTSEAGDSWNLCKIDELTIDLGGNTFTRGNYHMFQAMGRDATAHKTEITIKNGTLKANFYKDNTTTAIPPIICFTNHTENSGEADEFIFILDGITIDVTSGRNIVSSFEDGAGKTKNQVYLKDCTILRGTQTNSITLFALNDSSLHNDIEIFINGGKLEANSLKNLTFASYSSNNADKLVFGRGEKDGRYLTVTAGKNSPITAINGSWNTAEKIECVFIKGSENGENVNYTLYPAVMVGYKIKTSVTLWSNLVYNVYIPTSGVKEFTVNGKSAAYTTEVIDDVEYFCIAVNLPAGETLSDIKVCVTLNSGDTTVDANWTLNTLKYAKSVINGSFDDVTKALMKDMLAYASMAHTYFKNTENAADKLTEAAAILDGYSKQLPKGDVKKPTDKTYFTDVAIYLGAVPSFRFYLAENYTADDFTFNVEGRGVAAVSGNDNDGKGDYLEVVMYAYMMLEDVSYTVNGIEVTESYNLYAYYAHVSELLASNPDNAEYANAKALTEALMKYSVSAKDYRDSVIN